MAQVVQTAMVTFIAITGVRVSQGPAYEFDYPDGGERGITCDWVVEAYVDGDDCMYTHEHHFPEVNGREAAEALAARVEARGSIDLQHWYGRVMYGTESWIADGFEAEQMRDERENGGW